MITLNRVSVLGLPRTAPLHDVDLRLDPGAFTLVAGPRGAGQSTLVRCANGLIDPTAGSVCVEHGQSLRDRRVLRRHLRRIAMVFRAAPPYGSASVLSKLLEAPGAEEPPREPEGLGALRRVDLHPRARDRFRDLSAEELQRFSVARAILGRPEWILAYEPVETLDLASAHSTLDLLGRIARENGTGVLASITRADVTYEAADRVIVLVAGRVAQDTRGRTESPWRKEGSVEIHYCSGCGNRLERSDFIRRGAGILDHRPYCGECLRRKPELRTPERSKSPRRRAPVPR